MPLKTTPQMGWPQRLWQRLVVDSHAHDYIRFRYWPQTAEGRVLLHPGLVCLCRIWLCDGDSATFFVGRDAEDDAAEVAGAKSIAALHAEIKALRAEVRALSRQTQTRKIHILLRSIKAAS